MWTALMERSGRCWWVFVNRDSFAWLSGEALRNNSIDTSDPRDDELLSLEYVSPR